ALMKVPKFRSISAVTSIDRYNAQVSISPLFRMSSFSFRVYLRSISRGVLNAIISLQLQIVVQQYSLSTCHTACQVQTLPFPCPLFCPLSFAALCGQSLGQRRYNKTSSLPTLW